MAQFVACGHGSSACYDASFPRPAGTTHLVYRPSYVAAWERRPLDRTSSTKMAGWARAWDACSR